MSMISAQIDELRELATRYDELQVGAVKAVTMPSDMGSILRDAADTICELRGALQVASVDYRHLADENAKLRELVRDMHKALFSLNLDHCQACPREDACVFVHKSFDCNECAFERDMRELGVEVDE